MLGWIDAPDQPLQFAQLTTLWSIVKLPDTAVAKVLGWYTTLACKDILVHLTSLHHFPHMLWSFAEANFRSDLEPGRHHPQAHSL